MSSLRGEPDPLRLAAPLPATATLGTTRWRTTLGHGPPRDERRAYPDAFQRDLGKGVEPDECYYLSSEPAVRANLQADHTREPPPDLVVEVDLTASSARRMRIYAAMGVPEVWRHDGERLVVHRLREDGSHEEVAESRALPMMPIEEANRLLARRHASDDTALVRAFLDRLRQPRPGDA